MSGESAATSSESPPLTSWLARCADARAQRQPIPLAQLCRRMLAHAQDCLERALALAEPKVQKFLEGKEVKKFVYVPGRIVNLVAK